MPLHRFCRQWIILRHHIDLGSEKIFKSKVIPFCWAFSVYYSIVYTAPHNTKQSDVNSSNLRTYILRRESESTWTTSGPRCSDTGSISSSNSKSWVLIHSHFQQCWPGLEKIPLLDPLLPFSSFHSDPLVASLLSVSISCLFPLLLAISCFSFLPVMPLSAAFPSHGTLRFTADSMKSEREKFGPRSPQHTWQKEGHRENVLF